MGDTHTLVFQPLTFFLLMCVFTKTIGCPFLKYVDVTASNIIFDRINHQQILYPIYYIYIINKYYLFTTFTYIMDTTARFKIPTVVYRINGIMYIIIFGLTFWSFDRHVR